MKKTAKKAVKKQADTGDEYDAIKADMQRRRAKYSGEYWSPGEGTFHIRPVVFQHQGHSHLTVVDARHWNVEPGNMKSSVVCGGDTCPICENIEEMPQKLARKVKVQRKMLMNLIIRGAGDEKDKLVIARLPTTVGEWIEALAVGGTYYDTRTKKRVQVEAVPDILHPKRGRDMKLVRVGTEFTDTSYSVTPVSTPSAWGISVEPHDLIERIVEPDEEVLAKAAEFLTKR